MTPDIERRLEALEAFVIAYDRRGKTRRQFWDALHDLDRDLEGLAMAEDADPDVRWRYCEIMGTADEAGYVAPDERLDEVM